MHELPLRRHSALIAACILLFGFLCVAQIWLVGPSALRLEASLRQSVRQALVDANLPFAAVAAEGRTIALSGLVESRAQRAQALALVRQLPGVAQVNDHMEAQERYLILAQIRDGGLCLRGVAPSRALANEWQALAPCTQDPDAGLGVEEGPTAWVWPGALLREALKLTQADLEMSEHHVRVKGRTAHPDPLNSTEAILRGVLPKGLEVDIDIQDGS